MLHAAGKTLNADLQKAKRIERKKQQAAVAKAEELGLEPPAKKIPKVKIILPCSSKQ